MVRHEVGFKERFVIDGPAITPRFLSEDRRAMWVWSEVYEGARERRAEMFIVSDRSRPIEDSFEYVDSHVSEVIDIAFHAFWRPLND